MDVVAPALLQAGKHFVMMGVVRASEADAACYREDMVTEQPIVGLGHIHQGGEARQVRKLVHLLAYCPFHVSSCRVHEPCPGGFV